MDISQDLLRYGKTTTNKAAEHAKIIVRQNVLDAIGADQAQVLDVFAGEGAMYRAVWHQAASCVGCDKQFFMDDRLAYVADNRRLLRAIGLDRFSIFDFDSFGSPWQQIYLLAARRHVEPGERIGVVMTEGLGLKENMGGTSKDFAKLARIKTHMPGMGAARDQLIERAISEVCRMMSVTIERRWEARGQKGSRVLYLGMVLTGAAEA
jgi:hypothetical protein